MDHFKMKSFIDWKVKNKNLLRQLLNNICNVISYLKICVCGPNSFHISWENLLLFLLFIILMRALIFEIKRLK